MRLAVLLLLAALAALPGRVAHAHASLTETYPADQTAVSVAPPQILLMFNEEVTPITVKVLDAGGRALDGADVSAVDREVRVAFPKNAAPGSYIVTYRVTSADGHPVGGAFIFAVGAPPATWQALAVDAPNEQTWRLAAIIDHAFVLAGSLLAAGAVMFLLLFQRGDVDARRALRPLIRTSAAVALIGILLGIYIEGGLLLDVPFETGSIFQLWNQGASSTVGLAGLAGGVGLVGILLGRPFAPLAVALVIASFALSGHAATAAPRWLAVPTLLFHVALATFWIGSFVPLFRALGRGEATHTVKGFSQLAIVLVPQLVIAGAILGLLQVQALPALFETDYGLALFQKIVLVVILIGLAALNRLVLTPRLAAGVRNASRHLRLAIVGELLLGFAILVWTAYLSETVPPRSLSGHVHGNTALSRLGGAYNVAEAVGGQKALVQVNPGRNGWNTLNVHLLDKDGEAIESQEVTVELSQPSLGIEPIHRALAGQGDGYFEHSGVDFAAPGDWTVRVEALISDFDRLSFETKITIR